VESKSMVRPALHKQDPKLKVEGLECDTGSDLMMRNWIVQLLSRLAISKSAFQLLLSLAV